MITPDPTHHVPGTTFPADRAPDGAVPLGERPPGLLDRVLDRLARVAISRLRVERGDVLVIRGEVPRPVKVALVRALHTGAAGDPVAVFLPRDCAVHVERARLEGEDRGYRETKSYGKDATPPRGVFTGIPDARDPETDAPR
jgi:hypothetical protein